MSEEEVKNEKIQPAQWSVAALAIAFAAGAVIYKLLMHEQLGHSAAMFLGIPAVLAVLLALAPRAKSSVGGIVKGITITLLIIAPLLGEGYLCILFAAPLFYIVGIVVGLLADYERKKKRTTLYCVSLVLLPMCLEGVTPPLSLNRIETVQAQRIVAAPAKDVQQELSQQLDLTEPLPAFLRIGFPRPLKASGQGIAVGDQRIIHFSGAEGDPEGDLQMRVAESRPGHLQFETVSDASKLTQWIRWTSSEVEWQAIDNQHTLVTWRIRFDRQLDPAWYFAPLERAAVKEAATYLIQASATPHGSASPDGIAN